MAHENLPESLRPLARHCVSCLRVEVAVENPGEEPLRDHYFIFQGESERAAEVDLERMIVAAPAHRLDLRTDQEVLLRLVGIGMWQGVVASALMLSAPQQASRRRVVRRWCASSIL